MCYQCEETTIKMPKIITDDDFGLVPVDDNSPKRHRKAVEVIATYFGRETENPTLYNATEPSGGTYEPYVSTKAFIFTETNIMHYTKTKKYRYPTKGACCFRKRRHEEIENPPWELDWIWLHPYYRNQRVLERHWDFFLLEFGRFFPTAPVSKAMKGFLDKKGYSYDAQDYFKK